MRVTERAITFDCEGDRMLGVLAAPEQPSATGVVIVVGGPQYRAGSHRQFVQLARHLAEGGHAVLRFDVRGMGDSEGAQRSFETLDADIGAAIDACLAAVPQVKQVVLWGLCDGASAALLYLDEGGQDARVQGLCLLNPWVRSAATLAATHVKHYYAQRLLQPAFWAKLLRGQVAGQALRGLLHNLRLALRPGTSAAAATDAALPYQQRMARAWSCFGGHILLVLSGNDYTAKEFLQAWTGPDWTAARGHPATERLNAAGADHTYSQLGSQQWLQAECLRWLAALTPAATAPAAAAPAPANGHNPPEHADAIR